jgi:hypothetical protein
MRGIYFNMESSASKLPYENWIPRVCILRSLDKKGKVPLSLLSSFFGRILETDGSFRGTAQSSGFQ